MKFSMILATAACMVISLANAADVSTATANIPQSQVQEATMPTPDQALQAVRALKLPDGVKLVGSTEPIQMTTNKEGDHTVAVADSDKQEQFLGGGIGGWGGLGWGGMYGGGWGGWGGFGPYRFGYSCGGLGGWAYPLGFWNTFGAGMWGGGCGLGIPYGGLFYC